MSQPPEAMKTRGVKVNINPSLLSRTQEERRIEREVKNAEKEAAKQRKAEAAMTKREQRKEAEERVAAAEDAQAQKRASMFSMRPDITGNSAVTTAHGSTRGHGAAQGRGVAPSTSIPAPAIHGKAGGRGRGRGRVHVRGRGRGQGRGGIVSAAADPNSIAAGEKGRQISPVCDDTETRSITEDKAAALSDVEIPPATELDTESEGPVKGDITMDDGESDFDESTLNLSAMSFRDYSDDDQEYCGDEEDYEADEEIEVEAKSKPKKKQPKSKEDPRALREDITIALVQPLKNPAAKRRGSTVESQP
ncbi:hypothetical protein VKT23_010232 [Stygiomarasmius scandens]|uniref:Uncharacterized protein n=1 Tax=Marasmiellus scandens TaxID=2682957 RepID=A0ABR1JD86_9AGAR